MRRSLHIRCSSLPSCVNSLSKREVDLKSSMSIESDKDFIASLIPVNNPPDMIYLHGPFATPLPKEGVFLCKLFGGGVECFLVRGMISPCADACP